MRSPVTVVRPVLDQSRQQVIELSPVWSAGPIEGD